MNYREGFNNDSEVVMLAGSVDFDGTRLISLGDPLTPDVEDWDAINFSELASEVNIDLEDLNSDFFDVTVTLARFQHHRLEIQLRLSLT